MTRQGFLRSAAAVVASFLCIATLVPILEGAESDPGTPLGRWIFSKEHRRENAFQDLAGDLDAEVIGGAALQTEPDAILLDGQDDLVRLATDPEAPSLPKRALTAEAWVAVLRADEWGGIVGFLQDNGDFEKGWLLGTRGSRFAFALATKGTDDGNGRLTYLSAASTFELGRFYHVLGTYDGEEMRLYVDGALVATSRGQSGDILYPDTGWYEIGAYHDDNELYPLRGAIVKVSVYDRALSPGEVTSTLEASRPRLPEPLRLESGPYVSHIGAGELLVTWTTEAPSTTEIRYGLTAELERSIRLDGLRTRHESRLRGLARDRDYSFRIAATDAEGRRRITALGWFDAASDLRAGRREDVSNPFPADDLTEYYAETARRALELSGARKGYCLDLGCETGRLAWEIARRSDLQIVAVADTPAKVRRAREALDRSGLYGVRASVHEGSLESLPFTSYLANLIVSERTLLTGVLPPKAPEALRILRPLDGTACLGQPEGRPGSLPALNGEKIVSWLQDGGVPGDVARHGDSWVTFRRRALEGSGEWSHLYADPGNTACSNDEVRDPVRVQWFGQPGPRNMIDRHHRAMGPIYKDGRIYIHGDNRILAIDAYNGTLLWDTGIPDSRRVAAMRDCGHVAATADYVYVAARESCTALDGNDGRPSLVFKTPPRDDGSSPYWGYVASVGDRLFGSGQKPEASITDHSREAIYEGSYFDDRPAATSETVFCVDRHSGELRWQYRRAEGSVIVNSAIAVADGRVVFVEGRHPEAIAEPSGRLRLESALRRDSAFVVALDADSGSVEWERPFDLSAVRHALFLSIARGKVLLVGTWNEEKHPRYDLHALDLATGELTWSNHYVRTDKPVNGDHGEQDQHPAIVGDTVFSRPYAFDLQTGKKLLFVLDRGGHGCGALTASTHYLFGRGGNPRIYPIESAGASNRALTRATRPGCWVNIIPAGGLILLPEGSSGCTCGFPLQTSLGLVPMGR